MTDFVNINKNAGIATLTFWITSTSLSDSGPAQNFRPQNGIFAINNIYRKKPNMASPVEIK